MCVLACQESRETKGISFEEISRGSVVVPGTVCMISRAISFRWQRTNCTGDVQVICDL